MSVVVPVVVIGYGSYWAGKGSARFDDNICYSNVIGELTDGVGRVARSSSPGEAAQALEEKARALPVYGYESSCQDILEALLR
ncbi:hypothetical protein [Leminorella grimontii]|uniref:hypothetical protein n=1 Tax=Leminorella grimontii TaxID=82981 RepID=UPI00321FF429